MNAFAFDMCVNALHTLSDCRPNHRSTSTERTVKCSTVLRKRKEGGKEERREGRKEEENDAGRKE